MGKKRTQTERAARNTLKKVLEQRNAARTEVESLKAEVERLHGDVRILAAEEIRKIHAENNAKLSEATTAQRKAEKERDQLLRDFEGALTRKLDALAAALKTTETQLATAQKEVVGLVEQNAKLSAEVAGFAEALERRRLSEEKLAAELASAKMEDTKQLRRRLQAKTQRVEELEREVAQLKRGPASPVTGPTTPAVLHELLSTQLRRKLEQEKALQPVPTPPSPEQQPQP